MRNFNTNSEFGRGGLRIGPGAISNFIKVMLITNIAVFILQNTIPDFTEQFSLNPYEFFRQLPNLFYQPFTYMFLHYDIWHLAFNMFALWMFGTEIEFTWGTKRFGKFYVLGGLAGAALTMIVQSSSDIIILGASGAIYSVLIAYWVMFPNRLLYIYFLFPVKVKWAIPGFLLLGFLFGGENIAHFAHLGGAIFGFLYMKSNWRWLSFNKKFKEYKYRKASAKMEKNRKKADEIMKRVDDILDRINEVGIENLTKEERKILEEASSDLSKKEMKE